eukprot:14117185-Heterocapsa_arctica.AAC.1
MGRQICSSPAAAPRPWDQHANGSTRASHKSNYRQGFRPKTACQCGGRHPPPWKQSQIVPSQT